MLEVKNKDGTKQSARDIFNAYYYRYQKPELPDSKVRLFIDSPLMYTVGFLSGFFTSKADSDKVIFPYSELVHARHLEMFDNDISGYKQMASDIVLNTIGYKASEHGASFRKNLG